jgi:hypothetical protein
MQLPTGMLVPVMMQFTDPKGDWALEELMNWNKAKINTKIVMKRMRNAAAFNMVR